MAALASPADLAARLGRTFSPIERAQAEALLAEASAAIRNHTRQTIDRASSTVTLEGGRSQRLVLPERPVLSVESVAVDGQPVTDWRRFGAVLYRLGGWGVRRHRWLHVSYGDFWAVDEDSAPSEVLVGYTHGYDQIPDDLRIVCLSRAAREMANPTGLTSLRIGDYSASYPTGAGFTAEELRILNRYRARATSVTLR